MTQSRQLIQSSESAASELMDVNQQARRPPLPLPATSALGNAVAHSKLCAQISSKLCSQATSQAVAAVQKRDAEARIAELEDSGQKSQRGQLLAEAQAECAEEELRVCREQLKQFTACSSWKEDVWVGISDRGSR